MAVVAHDAGAARLLFSWLRPLKHQLRFYVEGPALGILEQEFPGTKVHPDLEGCLEQTQLLLSGTGWSSDLEHRARLIAAAQGLQSIAVVDHWVNYHERFHRDGCFVVPQSLWVADAEAAEIAQREFPNLAIQQLPNLWLNKLVEDVWACKRSLQRTERQHPACNLLYFLEPLRDHQSGNLTGEEFVALEYWLDQLPGLIETNQIHQDSKTLRMRLRPHPSEPIGKYEAWIKKQAHKWPLELDPHSSLATSLAYADLAFGCETQALVAALACDIPSISTLPPSSPPCRLPHRKLQHLAHRSRP